MFALRTLRRLHAADAQALALAQGVEAQAHVLADHAAVFVLDAAGRMLQVAVQELAERPLTDEADAGRVLLLGVGQADLLGDAAHLGLVQLTHWKQRAAELRLRQPVQEVALVLARVQALEQLEAAVHLAHAGVVAGGDLLGAQAHRVVQEGLELDLGVAQHVGVGRAAGAVFAQEFGEHPVLVLGREVHVLQLDADDVGHRRGVQEVLARAAVLAVVVVFPVLHEDADDLVALLLEQPGRHRRVDAARQAHHHTLLVPRFHARIVPRGRHQRLTSGTKTVGSTVSTSSG